MQFTSQATKAILIFLMVASVIGLALSVVVHGAALQGMVLPGGGLVFGLHLGVFAIFIPAMFLLKPKFKDVKQKDLTKVALAGCPLWMKGILTLLLIYTAVNFYLFHKATVNRPKPVGAAPPEVVRGFSGHWMLFYGGSFAMLYSAIRTAETSPSRTCPNGHVVSPQARFCPDCGHVFEA